MVERVVRTIMMDSGVAEFISEQDPYSFWVHWQQRPLMS